MSISRRGARTIVVDGSSYLWSIRRKPTYAQGNAWSGLRVAVELAESGRRVLMVKVRDAHPSNWMGVEVDPIPPGNVADWIQAALHRGWTPNEKKSPFILNANEEAR